MTKKYNKIKRNHHFESEGQSYTAYINLDADMEVVDRGLPAISIKNDAYPDEYYDVDGDCGNINIDRPFPLGSFESDTTYLRTIFFDKKNNILPLVTGETPFDDDEDEDDNEEYCNVPCDKLLAALILFYCGIFDTVSLDFDDEHEVSDNMCDIWDFIIED